VIVLFSRLDRPGRLGRSFFDQDATPRIYAAVSLAQPLERKLILLILIKLAVFFGTELTVTSQSLQESERAVAVKAVHLAMCFP
jgi:hypothetical protein